jgi:hypothetical protein
MDYNEWIKIGLDAGWCGPAVCYTHDGLPTSQQEEWNADEDGEYSCIHIIRLYENALQKSEVEENHAPSLWRK